MTLNGPVPSSPAPNQARPRRYGAKPSGWGRTVLLVAVITSVVGVACYLSFFHSSATSRRNASNPTKLVRTNPLTSSADRSPSPPIYNPPPEDPVDSPAGADPSQLADPVDVAPAAVTLVSLYLEDPDFVGPSAHSGLYASLQSLKKVAQQVADDDGSDPKHTVDRQAELGYQIDVAIARTKVIINRASETDTARQTTQQLQDVLMTMRTQ